MSSTCHVSFLAANDTDHKHKFSLTYVTFLSDVLSLTPKSFGARSIFTQRRSTAEWPDQHQTPSLTGYEPKVIEPDDLEPRRIELDRNLGTDPVSNAERIMRENYQNPIAEDMDEFGKVGVEMSYISHRCIPITTQRRALQTRILKMENSEKCWLHRFRYRDEGIMNLFENQQLQGNLKQSMYRSEKQMHNEHKLSLKTRKLDDKFFSRSRSFRET